MMSRQFALYFAWSRPREVNVELGVLENRFPTLYEFRRAIWPLYEWARNPQEFSQDISGFLDHVILFDFQHFHEVITEATGKPPRVIQREGDQPPTTQLDDAFLHDIDTLIIVSLDHLRTEQRATVGELEALRAWTRRPEKCLVVSPHHDVGASNDPSFQAIEFRHHGDGLVPAQQRFGGFAHSVLEGLGIPVENRFGLSPAKAADGSPAPLIVFRDNDVANLLEGVTTFNLHPHLPHFHMQSASEGELRLLARQSINPAAEVHPFTGEGRRDFDAFVWAPPAGERAASVVVCDATLWSAAFGGIASLQRLWQNLAKLPPTSP